MNEGIVAFELSIEQRQDAAKAFKLLPGGSLATAIKDYTDAIKRLENVPLKNTIDFYLWHHKPTGGIRTFSALVQEYLAAKEKSGRRRASISNIRCRLGRVNKSFGERHVHTIVLRELENWLDQNKYAGRAVARSTAARKFQLLHNKSSTDILTNDKKTRKFITL